VGVDAAEQHGLEPLVLAHVEQTGLAMPADLRAAMPQPEAGQLAAIAVLSIYFTFVCFASIMVVHLPSAPWVSIVNV
jgi:hypothetical protein